MGETFKAAGNPTKGFFINMLTRDIELNDAILDLLDNCLDGVVRIRAKQGKDRNSSDFYSGYKARIQISKDSFIIEDNCGGIPLDIARDRAFRMGREESETPETSATVGIYGIGMKRAIFKIGKSALVRSITDDVAFTVTIPKGWEKEEDWDFPIETTDEPLDSTKGTSITISDLNEPIQQMWAEEGHLMTFVKELIGHVKESYSLIIERGFQVEINGIEVEPNRVSFIFSDDEKGIKPYVYQNRIGNVQIKLAVGFYAAPPTVDESDSMAERKPRRTDDAGWTVICNDRVVLYNNKDHLTGWGENGVPKYHTQFIGIRGIVEFTSNNPSELPMTTTKRGVDLASPVYSEAKKRMCAGTKIFTNFTNAWKGTANADTKYFSQSKDVTLIDLVTPKTPDKPPIEEIKFSQTRDGGKQFKPNLPKPPKETGDIVWIRFAVKESECNCVSNYLFEEERLPNEVGEKCFERILNEAQR